MDGIKTFLSKLMLTFQGNSLRYLKQLEDWQWLDRKQLLTLQESRLRDLLIHSYRHVPYYREVLGAAGIVDKSGVVNLDCFRQIPLLNKETIRAHFEDLKSDDLSTKKWFEETSGGSTGEPVKFIQDSNYADRRDAVKMLNELWTGYSVGQTKLMIWGSERDVFLGKETAKIRFRRWLLNQIWLNAFTMTPQIMHRCVQEINRLKPVNILAYAESLYEVALFIENEGLEVYSPSAIMTSAGVLHPFMREAIDRVFKTPIFNRYGSREVGDIACECNQHNGLHVMAPIHYVEVLHPDGAHAKPGEFGEIVVTLLTNYSMPLIRYCIGDIGLWQGTLCNCGRTWPLLKEIKGRETDIFLTKMGTKIHGEYFTHLFYFQDWVKKFQVIQEAVNQIRILIVPRKPIRGIKNNLSKKEENITQKILLVMGQDCNVKYNYVDEISPTASGKYMYTISKVKQQ